MTAVAQHRGWAAGLVKTAQGAPKGNELNVRHVLRFHPAVAGRFRWDRFAGDIHVEGELPWPRAAGKVWDEDDMLDVLCWMQGDDGGRLPATLQHVERVLPAVARERSFHSVQQFLDGLVWDGIERLDDWLSTYAGAAECDLNRMIGRRFILSMVARAFDPGCKADTTLYLEGEQGAMKSTLCEILGHPWSTDDLGPVGDKDAVLQLQRRWVVEIAELVAFTKREVNAIKAFQSRREDRIRPPYGREVVSLPRSCVFIGTTNQDVYLTDETGNRRTWPVRLGRVDVDALRRDRDQLLAEAVVAWHAGGEEARHWIDRRYDPPELLAALAAAQGDRLEEDVWTEPVRAWLADEGEHGGAIAVRNGVFETDVLAKACRVPRDRQDERAARRVRKVLRALGFEPRRETSGVSRARRWWRRRVDG